MEVIIKSDDGFECELYQCDVCGLLYGSEEESFECCIQKNENENI